MIKLKKSYSHLTHYCIYEQGRPFIYMYTLYNVKEKMIMVVYSMFPVHVRRRTLFSIHAQFAPF